MSEQIKLTKEEQHQKESDILFESFLNRYYFDGFREKGPDNGRMIELFVRGVCPSNCHYCYLKAHGPELYPLNCQDEKTILHNIELFCKWYIKNKFTCELSIFTGEIIQNKMIFKILDIMYEYFSDEDLLYRPTDIIYPENCDFIENDELLNMMQEYIDKFKKVGIHFVLSLSVDGKFMDENRDKQHSDDFYKKVGDFADRNFFAFHPMVSAENVDKWIDNYKWWVEDREIPLTFGKYLMMLEVRNNDWTEEAINNYLKFINFMIDYEFKACEKNIDTFCKRVFLRDDFMSGYDNVSLTTVYDNVNDFDRFGASCSVQKALCIRVGDLAIAPCHRLSYEKFIAGYLKTNETNDEIVGYKGKNIENLISIYAWNKDNAPYCSECDEKYWCPGPCFGSNYEVNKEIFTPPNTVCRLYKARTSFMMIKFESMGLFKWLQKNNPEKYLIYERYLNKIKRGFDSYDSVVRSIVQDEKDRGGRASEIRFGY